MQWCTPQSTESYADPNDPRAEWEEWSSLLRALKKRFDLEIDGRNAPARFGFEGVAQVVRAVYGVIFAHKYDGQKEFVSLVEGVEHFVAADGDRARALHAALDLNMAGIRLFALRGGRIGGEV